MSDAPAPHAPAAVAWNESFPFRSRRGLAAFALIVLLLYAAGVNAHWRFQRDSALYMGLARSLAEDGTYSFNGGPQRMALPGFPALLSLVYMTVGESFLAMNVLATLFGLGCVALGWLLFRMQPLTRRQTLACLLLLGFSRTLYYYSLHIMTDVPFTFFVLLGLYCGTRSLRGGGAGAGWWWAAAAAATLAACAVRPLGPALLTALAAAPWLAPGPLKRWRANLARTCAIVAPVAALGALWALRGAGLGAPIGTSYVNWFLSARGMGGTALHVVGQVPSLIASLSDVVLGSDLGTTAGVALGALIGVGFVDALRRGERLLCAYSVVYLGAVCLAEPGRRLLLPALPVLLLYLVLGAGAAASFLAKRHTFLSRPRLLRAGQVLLVLALLTNLTHLSKNVYESRAPDFYAATGEERLYDYSALLRWLRENARSDDCVLANENNLICYFSRVRTRRTPLESMVSDVQDQVDRMKSAGVTYMVVGHDKEPLTARAEELLRAHPDAFQKVAAFGRLDLYRVRPDRL